MATKKKVAVKRKAPARKKAAVKRNPVQNQDEKKSGYGIEIKIPNMQPVYFVNWPTEKRAPVFDDNPNQAFLFSDKKHASMMANGVIEFLRDNIKTRKAVIGVKRITRKK